MRFARGSTPSAVQPRAVGIRLPYARLPRALQDWTEQALGATIVAARTQIGGMSPGCAARLRTEDGRTAFVKAVGVALNSDTPKLFRHEITVLQALPRVSYRPGLLATYDDGNWVGLLLDDVDGRHPDLNDTHDTNVVWNLVADQARELTPHPPALQIMTLADTIRDRWTERWRHIVAEPERYLPDWAIPDADALFERVRMLPHRLAGQSLCHWDLRNDNLLIRPDDTGVIIDWGMSRIGPVWADEFNLSLQWAGTDRIVAYLAGIAQRHGVTDDLLTDLLVAFAGSRAWNAQRPPRPGLPNMAEFCASDARRLFSTAHGRMNTDGP